MTSASPSLAPVAGTSRDALLASIDALAAANRAHPDAQREIELFRRRAEVAAMPTGVAPASPWPPRYEDPFPPGLPEVPADRLTVESLGAALQHHGALLVRGLFSPAQTSTLVECIDRTLAASQRYRAGESSVDTAPGTFRRPCSRTVCSRKATSGSASPTLRAAWIACRRRTATSAAV